MSLPKISIIRISDAQTMPLPRYGNPVGTSMTLLAGNVDAVKIAPNHYTVIETGLAIALPVGLEAQVRSLKQSTQTGVFVMNAPLTIDASDRQEIKVCLYNASTESVIIKNKDPIALLVFSPAMRVEWDDLNDHEFQPADLSLPTPMPMPVASSEKKQHATEKVQKDQAKEVKQNDVNGKTDATQASKNQPTTEIKTEDTPPELPNTEQEGKQENQPEAVAEQTAAEPKPEAIVSEQPAEQNVAENPSEPVATEKPPEEKPAEPVAQEGDSKPSEVDAEQTAITPVDVPAILSVPNAAPNAAEDHAPSQTESPVEQVVAEPESAKEQIEPPVSQPRENKEATEPSMPSGYDMPVKPPAFLSSLAATTPLDNSENQEQEENKNV